MATVITPIDEDTTFEEWKDKTNVLIDALTDENDELKIATLAQESAIAMVIALS